MRLSILMVLLLFFSCKPKPKVSVLSFYTARNDAAHISFVKEANAWFLKESEQNNFRYDTTSQWGKLNPDTLSKYHVILFLDTRPDDSLQRVSFEQYMKQGGTWIGFHFAGFALTPSDYPQNWDWYHEEFLGAGQYASNTWRPTSAILRLNAHPITNGLSETIITAPNEWYRWENDLRQNGNIDIIASIDSTSFPLGTGPKAHEIWHNGYYPVVWSNKKYNMVYFNMGHNDMDYEGGTNKALSSSFSSPEQNQLIRNSLNWLFTKSSAND